MKNVKVILISVALCATVFANSRIDALGGDAGFWAGDRQNIGIFPATINDHQFLEIDGVGNTGVGEDGVDATLLWGDATKWGFNFTGDDRDTWFNIMWGNGDVGLNVQYMTTDWSDNDLQGVNELGAQTGELTGFSVGYGQNFDWGELGVSFSSIEDWSSYSANWRADMSAWVFDSAKASFTMTDSGSDVTSLALSFDLFTHLDAGAADILFGLGVDYTSEDNGFNSSTSMTLPSATIAVESALNDWATLRAFVNHSYVFSCSNEIGTSPEAQAAGAAGDCTHDAAGPSTDNAADWDEDNTSYGFGLGFNWGSASLDMTIGEELFTSPIENMMGYDADAFIDMSVTLSYTF